MTSTNRRYFDLASIEVFTKSQLVTVGLIVLILPLFEPASLEHFLGRSISTFYNLGKVVTVCALLLLVVVDRSRFTLLTSFMTILVFLVFVSTLFEGSSAMVWISKWIPCYAMVLLFQCCHRSHMYELVVAVFVVTSVLSALNFVSVILFPDGMYATLKSPASDNFFWGNRNTAYQIVLPAIVTSLILDAKSGKTTSVRSCLLILIGATQVMLAYSATSIIALAVVFVVWALPRICPPVSKVFTGKTLVGAYAIGFYLIVIVRIQTVLASWMSGVLARSVQRAATLTGRTDIWDVVFRLMSVDGSFFGYGANSNRYLIVPWSTQSPFSHAHNEVLNTWLSGGWPAIVVFVLLVALIAVRLDSVRLDRVRQPIVAVLAAFFVVALTETTLSASFYLVLSLAYYAGDLARLCLLNESDNAVSEPFPYNVGKGVNAHVIR